MASHSEVSLLRFVQSKSLVQWKHFSGQWYTMSHTMHTMRTIDQWPNINTNTNLLILNPLFIIILRNFRKHLHWVDWYQPKQLLIMFNWMPFYAFHIDRLSQKYMAQVKCNFEVLSILTDLLLSNNNIFWYQSFFYTTVVVLTK